MNKKLFFTLFYLGIVFSPLVLPANGEPSPEVYAAGVSCDAPPPENFRVTTRGTHFIGLEWEPIFEGADHFLEVFEETSSGDWSLLETFTSVQASSQNVTGLLPGKRYRFKIATKCSNGDPSTLVSIIDDSTVILELTLGGRMPIEPQVKGDCEPLEYLGPKNEWVGYKVSYQEGDVIVTNFFEFVGPEESTEGVPQLRRFITYNDIVAADEDGLFPRETLPEVDLQYDEYVYMGKIFNGFFQQIGLVDISLQTDPVAVTICKVHNGSWNESFTFEPMVARKASNVIPNNRTFVSTNRFVVQNPIGESIDIVAPSRDTKEYSVMLWDTQGCLITQRQQLWGNVSITDLILKPGVYILEIKSQGIFEIIKVIKTN